MIILDWMLPKISGIDVLKTLRARKYEVPTIMMTAKGSITERVEGLDQGADDYIVKPFAMLELIARINALYRRSLGRGTSSLTIGGLTFDLAGQTVLLNNKYIELTSKEYDLLIALAAKADQVIQRSKIASLLYQLDDEPESNSLDVLLARVRKKIIGSRVEIETIRGKGFVLHVETSAS